MKYIVRIGTDYLGKGSYVFQGERFAILTDRKDARRFVTWDSAQNRVNAISRYANFDSNYSIQGIDD